jgi:hypothetical protein
MMKLPDHRRAISGRVFAQAWQPCAVEHYRPRRWIRRVGAVLVLVAVTAAFWVLA